MSKNIRFFVHVLFGLVGGLILLTPAVGTAENNSGTKATIEKMIQRIETEKSSPARHREAESLAKYVASKSGADLNGIDVEIAVKLSRLLGDEDDLVRFWVAGALGIIGPPAAGAVPALEKALKEAEPVQGSGLIVPALTSAAAIRRALEAITGREPTRN